MSEIKEIRIPDIGGAEGVDVVEVLVKPGDTIALEDPLLTLESEKATMDIPATEAGTIKEIKLINPNKVEPQYQIVYDSLANNLIRACYKAAPFDQLPKENYTGSNGWNNLIITFDAHNLL